MTFAANTSATLVKPCHLNAKAEPLCPEFEEQDKQSSAKVVEAELVASSLSLGVDE